MFICFPGNTNLSNTFGGLPFYLTRGLSDAGATAEGLDLSETNIIKVGRYLWSAQRFLSFSGLGGYQYSDFYLNGIWKNKIRKGENPDILSIFQLLPNALVRNKNINKFFYIDMTLLQLFDFYKTRISSGQRALALSKERAGYESARAVMCRSAWAAKSVVEHYHIDPKKVYVVLPGGNLPKVAVENINRYYDNNQLIKDSTIPLKLIFIGKEPERKGLFRLLDAMDYMRNSNDSIALTVVGPDPRHIDDRYKKRGAVRWLGQVDKAKKPEEFATLLLSHDIGVLLSRAEAGGISLREFQAAGLAVLAPNVGGSPEMLVKGAGLLVNPNETPQEIAAKIDMLIDSPNLVAAMKVKAAAARDQVSWEFAARQIINIVKNHSDH